MRISVIGPVYPFRGGIAHHTGVLCQSLQDKGHEIQIISFRKLFPKFLFPGKTQFDLSETALKTDSERLFTPWNPLTWISAARKVQSFAPDLVVFIWWTPFTGPGYWMTSKLLKGRSKLFLLHNAVPHEKVPFTQFISKLVFRQSGGFITQSTQVQNELMEFYPPAEKKWRKTIPHPAYNYQDLCNIPQDEARRKLDIKESRVLLYFGIIRQYKGLMTLIEAFPAICKKFGSNIRLLIAGEFYDDPAPYMQAISAGGYEDKITVIDNFIPNEEVGIYFSAADVVVLPYKSASQSGVIQTAYGFGKPVITSDTGGLPEVVKQGETGLLFPPGDHAALAEAVIRFYRMSDETDWENNVNAVRNSFSWDKMVDAVEEFAGKSQA